MAEGRMFSNRLFEDVEHRGLQDSLAYKLLKIHLFADDEGYVDLRSAKKLSKLSKNGLKALENKGFLEIDEKENILKINEFKKYQKIAPFMFKISNLKHFWKNSKNIDDAIPDGYVDYLKKKALEIKGKLRVKAL